MKIFNMLLMSFIVTSCISDCVICGGEVTPKGQRKIVRQAKRKERAMTRQQIKENRKHNK